VFPVAGDEPHYEDGTSGHQNKTMKPIFSTLSHFRSLARTLLAAVAVLGFSTAHTSAAVVTATYTTGAEVPVSSKDFTASGKIV
jgi:hypothetical protein